MFSRSNLERSCILALSLAGLAAAAPCDIYASGGTPCVAAHSTTRALYSSFNGALYQVTRLDGATTTISPLSAGGVANAAAQDSFCNRSTCVISTIYDQSGRGNHLTRAPKGAFSGPEAGGVDNLASATGAPVTLNGQKAYGVFISPGTGYRNNKANGIAVGDAAQGMYAVVDGTHYNGGCCFDYGNAETSSTDTGNGHMEAIYFGDSTGWGSGSGSGPWIMADLENGLFSGEHTNSFIVHVSLTSCSRPRCQAEHRRPFHHQPLHHRRRQRYEQPLGHPWCQRCLWFAFDVFQWCTSVGRVQPHEEGGCHHPRHRRRQQHQRRTRFRRTSLLPNTLRRRW
jgi:hypothetical protein